MMVPYNTASSQLMVPMPQRFAANNILSMLLLTLLLGAGFLLLLGTVQVALINTLLIFVFITLMGLKQCRGTANGLADRKLKVLSTFWLIKVGMTLFLLYAGWIPQLDPSSVSWGYDPQRFYRDAYALIENGWNPLAGSNYQGIIFYYGAIFYVFGHNPVIPALINAFVTLLGTLFLIRIAYEFKAKRTHKDWKIAYLLLCPEFLWYDVMTSRETLMAVLVLVSTLSYARYLLSPVKVSLHRSLLVGGLSFIILLPVRTSMGLPVVASILVIALFLRVSSHRMRIGNKLLVGAVVVLLLFMGPLMQEITGGYNSGRVDLFAKFQNISSFEANVASKFEWSQNSVGLLLAPNGLFQTTLFLFPRTLLYLVAPLPNIAVSISDLIAGSWMAWQKLFTIPGSMLNIISMPYAFAGFALAYRQRKQKPAPLAIFIIFLITLLAIAGGNIIIHERYRLMMTLLLLASAWLGYTSCTRKQIKIYAMFWYGFLACAAVFYIKYKIF